MASPRGQSVDDLDVVSGQLDQRRRTVVRLVGLENLVARIHEALKQVIAVGQPRYLDVLIGEEPRVDVLRMTLPVPVHVVSNGSVRPRAPGDLGHRNWHYMPFALLDCDRFSV